MIKIKDDFYLKSQLYNAVSKSTIRELLRIIKNYTDEKYIEDVLCELRELLEDTYCEDEIQEVIDTLSSEIKVCPKCGFKLTPTIRFETHTELEGNPKEEYMCYVCNNCGYDDSDNV